MWLLQALCRDYHVDVVTRGGWDLDDLNRCAGTEVRGEEFGAIVYPLLDPHVLSRGGALWNGLFERFCRSLAPRYDLCITASRTLDWGRPALHFLSDVAWNRPLQERFHCPEALVGASLFRKTYFALGRWLAGSSGRDPARHDYFVANSKWTAQVSSEFCKVPPVVIYPAVPGGSTPPTPWKNREDAFVCLGRISPEKQIEQVIAILDQVRIMGHDVRLHLVGIGVYGEYLEHIRQLCEMRKEWIIWHGPLYADDKWALLARSRYGISACAREAFGIATAEMMKAGMVPFVPRAGAQSEIVQEDDLIYDDIQEATLKIDAVLRSGSRQQELHLLLLQRAEAFHPEQFNLAVRELVERMLVHQAPVRTV